MNRARVLYDGHCGFAASRSICSASSIGSANWNTSTCATNAAALERTAGRRSAAAGADARAAGRRQKSVRRLSGNPLAGVAVAVDLADGRFCTCPA